MFIVLTSLVTLSGSTVGLLALDLGVPRLDRLMVAAIGVALSLVAGQLRFARASALEQTGESFVKMLKAKGAGRLRPARHVLRNAAIPIVAISISDLLAVLVLNIYVIEEFLRIEGLAEASLEAAVRSDIPLLIWSTMVVLLLGITARFLQDVLHGYLDPRVGTEWGCHEAPWGASCRHQSVPHLGYPATGYGPAEKYKGFLREPSTNLDSHAPTRPP